MLEKKHLANEMTPMVVSKRGRLSSRMVQTYAEWKAREIGEDLALHSGGFFPLFSFLPRLPMP